MNPTQQTTQFGARFSYPFDFANVAAGATQEKQVIIDGYDFLVEDPLAFLELYGSLGNLVAGNAINDQVNYTAANQAPTTNQFRMEISINGTKMQNNPVKVRAFAGSPGMPKINHRPFIIPNRQTVTIKLYNDSAVAANAQIVLNGTRLNYKG